jgi:hypothetical protein
MKAFYTIISAVLNTYIPDRVSLGLLMIGENQIIFNYSEEKLRHVKKFFHEGAASLLEESLSNINKTVDLNNEIGIKDEMAVNPSKLTDPVFTEKYINYLSVYNQNLLSFSQPYKLFTDIDSQVFDEMFKKLIYKAVPAKEKRVKSDIIPIVKKNLYSRIQQNVNIDKTISPEIEIFNNLTHQVKVNLIGKNGITVAGNVFDFTRGEKTLNTHAGDYLALIKAIESNNSEGKYFVIGKEPDKVMTGQHKKWNHFRNINYFDYVDISELDRIHEYIKEKDVQPMFDKE